MISSASQFSIRVAMRKRRGRDWARKPFRIDAHDVHAIAQRIDRFDKRAQISPRVAGEQTGHILKEQPTGAIDLWCLSEKAQYAPDRSGLAGMDAGTLAGQREIRAREARGPEVGARNVRYRHIVDIPLIERFACHCLIEAGLTGIKIIGVDHLPVLAEQRLSNEAHAGEELTCGFLGCARVMRHTSTCTRVVGHAARAPSTDSRTKTRSSYVDTIGTAMPPTPPAIFMRATLLLSAVTLVSALAGLVGSAMSQAYYLAGFEVIVVVACILGVLTGLGKFNSGPSIAIACTAGTIFVGAVLGYISLAGSIFGVRPLYFLAFRVLIAFAMFGCAGGVLLARRPGASMRLLLLGVAFGAPVVLALGAWMKIGAVRQAVHGVNPNLLAVLATPLALLAIGLISASAHCLIRAFEIGVETRMPDDSAPAA